ncbi:DUF4328 domain-containing protein [Flavobacterium sp.]|uniref:DUF4328 domain-containing protein n=1 Tax=Flavobacterium sp. TaxID=239 RepID=UPI002FD87DC8
MQLKPNHQRAKTAQLLIAMVGVVYIMMLISSYWQYGLLQDMKSGTVYSQEVLETNDLREQFLAIVFLMLYITSAVTFIMWFRRAYFNLHQKINHLTHTEGWAAGSWFVPFINLYRPYQIMAELYNETAELLAKRGFKRKVKLDTTFVGIWWFLWLVSNLLANIVFRMSNSATDIDQFLNFTALDMGSDVLGIILALITIKVIKTYANAESFLIQLKDEEETSPVSEAV